MEYAAIGTKRRDTRLSLVRVPAHAKKHTQNAPKIYGDTFAAVLQNQRRGREDVFLLKGYQNVLRDEYQILESTDERGSAGTQIRRTTPCSQNPPGEPPTPTHLAPTGSSRKMGAADSIAPLVLHPQPQGKKNMSREGG